MEDQAKFLEMLEDMKEIARAQNNQLTSQEVRDYLGHLELSEKQWQAVYQYLGANHIQVSGYEYIPEHAKNPADSGKPVEEGKAVHGRNTGSQTETGRDGTAAGWGNPRLYQRYQQDLQQLSADHQDVPLQEIRQFLGGDPVGRDRIIESRLHQVVKLAKQYTKYSIPLEDLIAEGNLGLLNGLAGVEAERDHFLLPGGEIDIQAFLQYLERSVIDAMEQMIHQETESKSQETAMLAKTNLLHETVKYLAEENGKIPTVEELSEYTRMPVQEIRQIMDLSEDTRRLSAGR